VPAANRAVVLVETPTSPRAASSPDRAGAHLGLMEWTSPSGNGRIVFTAVPGYRVTVGDLLAVARAFAGGSVGRYGFRAALWRMGRIE
jgi:hypothetical protein